MTPAPPAPWVQAVTGWQEAVPALARPGRLSLHDLPAPQRLSPYAVAVGAELCRAGEPVGGGRLVVLHDPAGQEGWRGDTRVVAYVSADVDPEMAADPVLPDVGWSWLVDALAGRDAAYDVAGGTVTRTVSATYGELDEGSERSELEVRASWTVLHDPDDLALVPHLLAWRDLLCAACGVPL